MSTVATAPGPIMHIMPCVQHTQITGVNKVTRDPTHNFTLHYVDGSTKTASLPVGYDTMNFFKLVNDIEERSRFAN